MMKTTTTRMACVMAGLVAMLCGCSGPQVGVTHQPLAGDGESFVMLPVVVTFEPAPPGLIERMGGAPVATLDVVLEEVDGARYTSEVDGLEVLGLSLVPGRYRLGGVRGVEVLGCTELEVSAIPQGVEFEVSEGDEVVYAGRLELTLRLVEGGPDSSDLCRVEVVGSAARDCLSRDLVVYQRAYGEVDWRGLKVISGQRGDAEVCP